jgi:hypothetical protein
MQLWTVSWRAVYCRFGYFSQPGVSESDEKCLFLRKILLAAAELETEKRAVSRWLSSLQAAIANRKSL